MKDALFNGLVETLGFTNSSMLLLEGASMLQVGRSSMSLWGSDGDLVNKLQLSR
jgi:hypothetical protein